MHGDRLKDSNVLQKQAWLVDTAMEWMSVSCCVLSYGWET
jgi:hypothetical protein